MKPLLHQDNSHFLTEIQKYGCAFISLYYISKVEHTYKELNAIWEECKAKGILSASCNILDWTALAKALGIDATYTGIHAAPTDHIAPNQFALGEYFYKTSHFVAIDRNKKLLFDPIQGGSQSVKYGTIRTLRIFTYEGTDA